MKKLVLLGLTAGILVGATTVTFAADPAEKALAARRGYMQVLSFNAGPLFAVMKGEAAYDAKQAKALAENIKNLSSVDTRAMWVKASDVSNAALKGKTTATAGIYDSKFKDSWAAYRKASVELAAAAGDGKDAMTAKLKAFGGTCAACHKASREKK